MKSDRYPYTTLTKVTIGSDDLAGASSPGQTWNNATYTPADGNVRRRLNTRTERARETAKSASWMMSRPMRQRKVAENTAPGTDIGAPVEATDEDDCQTY